jgi:hypothetical protein
MSRQDESSERERQATEDRESVRPRISKEEAKGDRDPGGGAEGTGGSGEKGDERTSAEGGGALPP